jgi:nitrite reductase/ring-hydroxylating ferredoxin subunit
MKHIVCKDQDLKCGEMKAFTLENKSIVIARSKNGEFYALRNVCPHKGPALSLGSLDGSCTSYQPGEYILEKDREVIKCPWHSWEFDIKTGCSLFDPESVRVKTYEVTVEDGTVFIQI